MPESFAIFVLKTLLKMINELIHVPFKLVVYLQGGGSLKHINTELEIRGSF